MNATSPSDHPVTHGHLCIKGRFGFPHVQNPPVGVWSWLGRCHGPRKITAAPSAEAAGTTTSPAGNARSGTPAERR